MTITERTWNSDLIGWIKEAIRNGQTTFQDATTEVGIRVAGDTTRFPDVLLILNRTSYEIFNGWELKFPDIDADNPAMLENALLKAKQIRSNSLVTWNGKKAIIWRIRDDHYNLASLEIIKDYPLIPGIVVRRDLSDFDNYVAHQPRLRARLLDILHDLDQYRSEGTIRPALNIRNDIVGAITDSGAQLIPLFAATLNHEINNSETFRSSFGRWKILESSTLKILAHSSRRRVIVNAIEVLARFLYYKIIGKIVFYKTLAENLSGRIPALAFDNAQPLKPQLDALFAEAQRIDYQAVFDPDFTDDINFSEDIDRNLKALLGVLAGIDFRYLPNDVIGYILENLVPKEEKQKFGQYFTSEKLAYLVGMSAIAGGASVVIDPTSGTGSFLNAFYNILKFRGTTNHSQLLRQVWGNDISHFPALLSVINLYKQNLTVADNFPRVTRKDFFTLHPDQEIRFPDPVRAGDFINVPVPTFDAIASNFPFIQQEDIDNTSLSNKFRTEFGSTQIALLTEGQFNINERSDYFIYCFYNSLKFLKVGGYLSAITSNAWLTKNYGLQFKKFLLNNFSIKMVVRSNAEHWFQDSKVSTIYTVLQKGNDNRSTKFVTLNFKLDEYLPGELSIDHLHTIDNLYNEIEHCDLPENPSWTRDEQFSNVYHKNDGNVTVSIVEKAFLLTQIESEQNWAINFIAQDPLALFADKMVTPFPDLMDTGRGTRANTDDYQILSNEVIEAEQIEEEFLVPAIKSSRELSSIHHTGEISNYIFHCERQLDDLQENFPHAYQWVQKFSRDVNKTGRPYPEVLSNKRPYWYSLVPEDPANIFISVGPGNKLFFAYCDTAVYLNQRLVAIRVPEANVLIMAALLNSILTLLMVELNGIPRAEGVLDLNADFFKTRIKILNPALLSNEARQRIINRFQVLANRPIEKCDTEYDRADRIAFDRQIFQEFEIDVALLPRLYETLKRTITDREEMKDR
ncbi:MAG: N-6 DNA methylase [Chryseotalea sp.]|jgi:type I restriction-modification system DNA methylase subunit|nr:N-6 DNA methylase [Cytophagales bacterium]